MTEAPNMRVLRSCKEQFGREPARYSSLFGGLARSKRRHLTLYMSPPVRQLFEALSPLPMAVISDQSSADSIITPPPPPPPPPPARAMARRNLTEHISARAAKQLAQAALSAFEQGYPLNVSLTIHFRAADIEPAHAQIFITRFFKLAGDWLCAVGHVPRSYVWALESPGDKGLHMHALLHVPYHQCGDFRRRCPGWIEKAGGRLDHGVLKIKDVDCSPLSARVDDYLDKGLGGAVKYLLKGSDPGFCKKAGINHSPQGRIRGKRTGRSQNLRPAGKVTGAGLPDFQSDCPPPTTLEQYIRAVR